MYFAELSNFFSTETDPVEFFFVVNSPLIYILKIFSGVLVPSQYVVAEVNVVLALIAKKWFLFSSFEPCAFIEDLSSQMLQNGNWQFLGYSLCSTSIVCHSNFTAFQFRQNLSNHSRAQNSYLTEYRDAICMSAAFCGQAS